jgi:hypothetical protein
MTTEATEVTSAEDKFFGVKTEIRPKASDATKTPAPEITIEEEGTDTPAAKVVAKPPAKPSKADEDAELATYSEGVQKRIKKMRWKQGEIERERDAVIGERDEAFRVAHTLHGQNQQYVQTINTGEARLVAEIKQRSENAVKIATSAYAEAYESGKTDKIIEAQNLMINANADLRAANQYEGEFKQRQPVPVQPQQQAYVPQPAPVQRQVPSVPKPTEDAANWAEENPWFGDPDHADMTALAYGVHERLIKHDGIKPDTPEYFETINSEMRQRFPEQFTEEQGDGKPAPTQKKTPATVVGSAQKQTPKNTRKVVLKATQVRLAKRLGLTVEQYATQLIKEGN